MPTMKDELTFPLGSYAKLKFEQGVFPAGTEVYICDYHWTIDTGLRVRVRTVDSALGSFDLVLSTYSLE
ncbi:hypothetical protein [Xanthomonas phage SB1]|uniref:Uncharacterized protein n=1 Tax=Xanthomonas phage SB1 TaxID=3117471 RepID=A0ABZ2GXW0_9CAUD